MMFCKHFLLLLCFTVTTPFFSQQIVTLVIDAGHGGKDPGNLHQQKGLKDEKELNLLMAKKFGNYVDMYLGHKVKIVYSRTTDVYVSLEDRVANANALNADYFISIHCNASEKKRVKGAETHVHTLKSKISIELAHEIQNQFANRAGRMSRGVKVKNDSLYNLMVLKDSKMPAVLVETGFMTNAVEEKYLNSDKGQDLIASAVFRAFRDYIKKKHKVEMRAPNQPENNAINNAPVYKIQIMSSTGPVALDNPDFKAIGLTIEELKITNPSSAFNYKYYVGAYGSKKDAKEKLKEIRNGAFNDAFIVKFE